MDSFFEKKTKEVFGEEFELSSFEQLFGGAQKHTYLAKCTNGFEFVIYQWDKSTTFFEYNTGSAVFCSSSAHLFQCNNELPIRDIIEKMTVFPIRLGEIANLIGQKIKISP